MHPKEHDLVLGTHGRAAFVIDDIRPLRLLAREGNAVFADSLRILTVKDGLDATLKYADGSRFPGHGIWRGENRSPGALITYNVIPRGNPDSVYVKVEIVNDEGKVIRTLRGPAKPGINRVVWELRQKAPAFPTLEEPRGRRQRQERPGPPVLPGTYKVRIKLEGKVDSSTVEVLPDRRLAATMADRRAKYAAIMRATRDIETAAEALKRLRQTRASVQETLKKLRERQDSTAKSVQKEGRRLLKTIDSLMYQIVAKPVQGLFRNPRLVSSQLGYVYRALQSSWEAPTPAQMKYLELAEKRLKEVLDQINRFYAETLPPFKENVEALQLSWIKTLDKPLTLPGQNR